MGCFKNGHQLKTNTVEGAKFIQIKLFNTYKLQNITSNK